MNTKLGRSAAATGAANSITAASAERGRMRVLHKRRTGASAPVVVGEPGARATGLPCHSTPALAAGDFIRPSRDQVGERLGLVHDGHRPAGRRLVLLGVVDPEDLADGRQEVLRGHLVVLDRGALLVGPADDPAALDP